MSFGDGSINNNILLAAALDKASFGVVLIGSDLRWHHYNKAFVKLFKYEPEELDRLTCLELAHPDEYVPTLRAFQRLLTGKEDSFESRSRYICKDETVIWLKISISVCSKPEDQERRFIGQFIDITSEMRNEERFKFIVSRVLDGYWQLDIKNNIEYTSPRFWEAFGYQSEKIRKRPGFWRELVVEEDLKVLLDTYKKHVSSYGVYPMDNEIRFTHKNGSIVHVICRGKIIEWDAEGNPARMIGTITDISEYKKVQIELDGQKRVQSETRRLTSLGTLAGNIAHEINNPLTILSGHAEVINSCVKRGEIPVERVKRSATIIKSTIQRISTIISGLKSLSRDSSQDDQENFYLRDSVSVARFLLDGKIQFNHIDIRYSSRIERIQLFGQKVQFEQVITNLINNSIDAIMDIQDRWIFIDAEDFDHYTRITIEDSGKGLPQEIKDNLMSPFFTTKKNGKGTGIGLSICKNIIEKHFGRIYVDNESETTKFIIELPKEGVSELPHSPKKSA